MNMVFKRIVFDDFVDDTKHYNTYWVEMCPNCHRRYKGIIGNRADDGGTACSTCSVYGCNNEAYYYVDFDMNEVEFI